VHLSAISSLRHNCRVRKALSSDYAEWNRFISLDYLLIVQNNLEMLNLRNSKLVVPAKLYKIPVFKVIILLTMQHSFYVGSLQMLLTKKKRAKA